MLTFVFILHKHVKKQRRFSPTIRTKSNINTCFTSGQGGNECLHPVGAFQRPERKTLLPAEVRTSVDESDPTVETSPTCVTRTPVRLTQLQVFNKSEPEVLKRYIQRSRSRNGSLVMLFPVYLQYVGVSESKLDPCFILVPLLFGSVC